MAEKVKVLQIDTEPAQTSLKELRKALKGFKDEMANLDADSDAFKQLALQAGEVKHQIDEVNESVRGASTDIGDMIGNSTKATAGLVGAFQAVEGALQLLGVESNVVGEALVKMQSLMAITQGLASIDDGIKAFGKLKTAINLATASAQGLKKSLISTGIGAIVVAVGSIVAYWEDISKWLGLTTTQIQNQKQEIKELAGEYENIIDSINQANEITLGQLPELDKLEDTINKLNKDYQNLNRTVYSLKNGIGGDQIFRKWRRALKEQGVEVTTQAELIAYLESQMTKLKASISTTTGAYDNTLAGQDKLIKSYEDITEKLERYKLRSSEGYVLTITEQKEYNNLLAEEILLKERISNANWGLRYLQDRYDAEVAKKEAERQERLTEAQKEQEKRTAEAIRLTQEAIQYQIGYLETEIAKQEILDENYKATYDYVNKMIQIYDLQASLYEEDSVAYRNAMNKKLALLTEYSLIVKEMPTNLPMVDNIKELTMLDAGARMANFVQQVKDAGTGVKKTSEEIYSTFAGISAGITSVMSQTVSVLSTLANNQDATTEEGFKKQKQFNIATATMNGLMGILNAWVSAMSPTNAWMTMPGQIAFGLAQTAASATLMGIQIDAIKKQQLGGTGSTGGTPSANAIGAVTSAPVRQDVNGASITQALNTKKNTRVYVLESDITSTQDKVHVASSENVY